MVDDYLHNGQVALPVKTFDFQLLSSHVPGKACDVCLHACTARTSVLLDGMVDGCRESLFVQ